MGIVVAGSSLGPIRAADAPLERLSLVNEKLKSGAPVVFATFGDSITWPCYHTDYRQNYITFTVDALRRAYSKASIKIVHGGNMGTTRRGLNNGRFEKHVLAFEPDVVVIMFGMNDCGGGPAGLEAFDRNLVTLIRKTRAAGATPVLATQNEIFYDSIDGRHRTHLPSYMERTLQVARREDVLAVDCFTLWKPLKTNHPRLAARLNDWIHPNHAGHRLMAKAIVKTLWPDAAKFVSVAERTPPKREEEQATACLLPGPPGKQVLRTAGGMWFAVSGRNRNGGLTDLVLSYSRAKQPEWSSFRHVTLVGPSPNTVFDAMDRTLTAGLLLNKAGRIYVVFSWNVGVFMFTLREPRQEAPSAFEEWEASLARPEAWLRHQDQPFVRPTVVANSVYREGGLLHDAYLQGDGWPAVLCSDRKLPPGGGFEVTDGVDGISWITRRPGAVDSDRKFIHTGVEVARCMASPDATVFYAAQKQPGGPLTLGILGDSRAAVVADGDATQFMLPSTGPAGFAVVKLRSRQEDASADRWERYDWGVSGDQIVHSAGPIPDAPGGSGAIPLPWSDGSGQGIAWWQSSVNAAEPPPFAFQSQLSQGAKQLGILTLQDGRLAFRTLPLEH